MPGMLVFEKVPIQLVDTPALDRDFVEPGLMDLIRGLTGLADAGIEASPDEQQENALRLLEEHRILPEHQARQRPNPRNSG